ncbi:uncharacterized protein [Parasteatoda tepidariorum]|uniref:uncharacterized protein n=1 Tax=Parasteatoda tepidariorum TaxID=114398 RepID=UPI001C728EE3|nr:uncharacterized protein LOC107456086 [Parasteatoda tepidariorum]
MGEGIREEVKDNCEENVHYLPHRALIKPNSTTKIRPVFDASAKAEGFPSLNDCLEKDENLIELIPSILKRFWTERIGVVSDILKAVLQIGLTETDRNYLRFLWLSDEGLKIYRHCRIVFGVTSRPFLLSSTVKYLLMNVLKEIREQRSTYPEYVVQKLMKSFYADNCVTSVKDIEELNMFERVANEIMARRKFDLRGWEYTDLTEETSQPPTNVLGMSWDKKYDTLQVSTGCIKELNIEKVTKRTILSAAHRLFDPLGMICPVTLIPKLLLQSIWKLKLNWDDDVEENIRREFLKWIEGVLYIEKINIPRYFGLSGAKKSSIHFFCDASNLAYAVVAYIRVESENNVRVQLLQARSRVAPTGKGEITIARLELLEATIASRLSTPILSELTHDEVFFWSDSTTVLAWIKRSEPWAIFVYNRVREIREQTDVNTWRHVPGTMNPADLPSRGCSAQQLLRLQWSEGPSWLHLPQDLWPSSEDVVNEEERKGDLSVKELEEAEKTTVYLIQQESFTGVSDKRLKTLDVFIDEKEIYRLKTTVYKRDDFEEFRTPAILPGENSIVKRLVLFENKKKGHAGVSYTLNSLRERFWLLCGRRTVKSVLRSCVVCKRFSAKSVDPPTASPPADKVQDAAVFQVTGVDFAGPVILKDNSKAWICIFTCAVYRATHLELVTSLSTEAFLLCFHRFVCRRGKPSIVYSDNGTNFTGSVKALSCIDFKQVFIKARDQQITWKFIPPSAPWWGGFWERLVGMMKGLLKKTLGRDSLTYEEMQTALCNCEVILNERPLTTVCSDASLTALTPADFLKEKKPSFVPDIKTKTDPNHLRRRIQYLQTIREAFRVRFRQEYLGALCTRQKKNTFQPLKVGDIVILGDDNKKWILWPLGKEMETMPGTDGVVRRVRMKTKQGELIRAVQRVHPLEISSSESLPVAKCEKFIANNSRKDNIPVSLKDKSFAKIPVVTRSGRAVRKPDKLSL